MARRTSIQFSVYDKTALCVVSTMYLIAAVKEKNKFDICLALHDSVPALKVVLIAREAINKEAEFFLVFLHGVFHGLIKQKQRQPHIFYCECEFTETAVYSNDESEPDSKQNYIVTHKFYSVFSV